MALESITINTITRHDLEQCLERCLAQGAVTLLMIASPHRFQLGHIPGSQCFAVASLPHLPVDYPVIIYAAKQPSLVSDWAYWLLIERGFEVWLYAGGLRDWLEAGLPVQHTPLEVSSREVKQ